MKSQQNLKEGSASAGGFWAGVRGRIEKASKVLSGLLDKPEPSGALFLKETREALNASPSVLEKRKKCAALGKRLAESSDAGVKACLLALMEADRDAADARIQEIKILILDGQIEIASQIAANGIEGLGKKLIMSWLHMEGAAGFMAKLRARALENDGDPWAWFAGLLKEGLDLSFCASNLELRVLDWSSPAKELEKLVEYEQVHKMEDLGEMKRRLDKDRIFYAFVHPGWDEPVAFLEVALTKGLASNVKALLEGETLDPERCDSAMFYSINSPHAGLRGIPFGEDLIHRAVEDIRLRFPSIKRFCTLSPIPGFRKWVEGLSEEEFLECSGHGKEKREGFVLGKESWEILLMGWINSKSRNLEPDEQAASAAAAMLRLCAWYLSKAGAENCPADPVARFHLGNGARIERICPMGDASQKGIVQSYGCMANYLYDLKDLEKNRVLLSKGSRAAGWKVKELGRQK